MYKITQPVIHVTQGATKGGVVHVFPIRLFVLYLDSCVSVPVESRSLSSHSVWLILCHNVSGELVPAVPIMSGVHYVAVLGRTWINSHREHTHYTSYVGQSPSYTYDNGERKPLLGEPYLLRKYPAMVVKCDEFQAQISYMAGP
jgi:hypothetical protein